MKQKYDVTKHILVPKHIKISEKEKDKLFEEHGVSLKGLPKIRKNDPAIAHIDVKVGDVIKIIRKSPTAGECVFYRGVVDV